MKVARIYDFNDIRIEEMSVPEPGPREALVEVKACGICSGDVTPWYIRKKAPIVLGHEPAGRIAAIGKDAVDFKVGDRVFVHHHAPCFTCRHCIRGFYSMCQTWKRTAISPGGIAEYFLVPEINLRADTLMLPDEVSYEGGVLVEPTACSVKAFKRAQIKGGERVLQIGLGVMGQLNVLLARHYGASQIIGADMVEWRLNRALELGADAVVDVSKENLREGVARLTGGEMVDIVIVGPPKPDVMKLGIECAGKGGTVLFFMGSSPGEKLEIEPHHLYFNEIALTTSYSCGPYDTREALDLIARRIIKPEDLITHKFPIEETSKAFSLMAQAGEILKAIIVF